MYGIVDTVLDSLTFYMSKLSDNRTMPDPSHLLGANSRPAPSFGVSN